jgi:hypothetical protein
VWLRRRRPRERVPTGIGGSRDILLPFPLFIAQNKLTEFELLKTIFFQVGILGCGMLFLSLVLVPWVTRYQGMHPIENDERDAIEATPILRHIFKHAKRWYDHMWLSLFSTGLRTTCAFLVGLTFFIVLTDIGWLTAWNQYIAPDPNYLMFFLMARASGQPNGAHLPSYVSVAALGVYAAWRFRDSMYSVSADFYQAILLVGFVVGVHEGLWLIAYFFNYYVVLGLALTSNFVEDAFFGIMCIMLIVAYWRYPNRKIPMRLFALPVAFYTAYLEVWSAFGLPVSTINNWVIGQGIYGTTQWFLNPMVNGVEIIGWLLITGSIFLVINQSTMMSRHNLDPLKNKNE